MLYLTCPLQDHERETTRLAAAILTLDNGDAVVLDVLQDLVLILVYRKRDGRGDSGSTVHHDSNRALRPPLRSDRVALNAWESDCPTFDSPLTFEWYLYRWSVVGGRFWEEAKSVLL